MSDKLTVELTDAEVGVRHDSSDFEERAAFAAFKKAGEGRFKLHDIELIDGGARVYLTIVEDVVEEPCSVCGEPGCCTFDHDPDNDIFSVDDPICACDHGELGDEDVEFAALREMIAENERLLGDDQEETDPEKISSILALRVDDARTTTFNAADMSALIELIEFATQVLPMVQMPPEARSLAVSLERLRQRLGVSGVLGIGILPPDMEHPRGLQKWLTMPEFQPVVEQWLTRARQEYDNINGAPSPIVIARDDTGLRVED